MTPVPGPVQAAADAAGLRLPLLVRAGSRSYDLDGPDSDEDFLGVFVAPLRTLLSLRGLERESIAGNDPDFTIHEIGKFCRLALKGNPAILETLWNPDVVAEDELGRRLRGLRGACLHRGSLDVYISYAGSQMRRMVNRAGLHAKGGTYNGKFGAHLVRLLHAGLHLARRGEVMVRVPDPLVPRLLEIRRGEVTMDHVLELARPLLRDLEAAAAANSLPAAPDEAAFEALVVAARKGGA